MFAGASKPEEARLRSAWRSSRRRRGSAKSEGCRDKSRHSRTRPVKRLRSLRDKKAAGGRRPAPRRGPEDPRPKPATAAGCPRSSLSQPRAPAHPLAAEIIAAADRAGGEAIEVPPDLLSQDERQGQSADAARCLPAAVRTPLGRYRPPAHHPCGSSPRRCATRAISAPSFRTGDGVAAGGMILIDDSADPVIRSRRCAPRWAPSLPNRWQRRSWDEFLALAALGARAIGRDQP